MQFMPRYRYAAPARLLAIICVAALVVCVQPAPTSAQSNHCKSDKHVMHDGAIHGVTIENIEDRDGDGYASRFILRLRADSRQSQFRQQGKGLMKAFHKVFMGKIGLPLPFTANEWCLDLVPGYKIQVQTEDKEWIDWGYRHINDYEAYPGPGDVDDEADFRVTHFGGIDEEGTIILNRRPDDHMPRRSFNNDGSLTNGDRAVLTGLYIRTCWKPMGRMKAADEDIPKYMGCVDLDGNYEDFREIFRQALVKNIPRSSASSHLIDLTDQFDGGFKVEVPELDQKAKITTEEQNVTQTPAVTRTLGGQVLSQETRDEISRAEIVFQQTDGNATRTVFSSTEGRYSIEVPVGTYEVEINQALYHAETTTVVVSEESNATANFFLTPDEEAAEAAAKFAEQVERGRGGLDTNQPVRRLPETGGITGDNLAKNIEALGGAADFSGTWDTKFGELRLHQTGDYVIGDYASNGVMVGKVSGTCVAGVFTNGERNGIFRFDASSGSDKFEGQWAWHGDNLGGTWNGTRTSGSVNKLRNFTRNGAATQVIDNERTVYDGTYDSPHGEIKLFARDLFLVGDYAGKGVIAGMWDGNSYVGRFTNEERTG